MPAAAIFGTVLGCLYFGGLWLSVSHLGKRRSAPLFLVGGFALRSMILLGSFYLVSRGDPVKLVCALFGFVMMRIVFIHILRARTRSV